VSRVVAVDIEEALRMKEELADEPRSRGPLSGMHPGEAADATARSCLRYIREANMTTSRTAWSKNTRKGRGAA